MCCRQVALLSSDRLRLIADVLAICMRVTAVDLSQALIMWRQVASHHATCALIESGCPDVEGVAVSLCTCL